LVSSAVHTRRRLKRWSASSKHCENDSKSRLLAHAGGFSAWRKFGCVADHRGLREMRRHPGRSEAGDGEAAAQDAVYPTPAT
jgi:hypothetical protein